MRTPSGKCWTSFVTDTEMEVSDDFKFWVTYGYRHGYVSDPFCWTHGSVPVRPEELEEMEGDDPPCLMAVRIYPQ